MKLELHKVALRVNGADVTLRLAPWTTLLDALREQLQLTGTKKGCDHGQCGACTVLVDGRRVNACLTLAVMSDGREVTTVEGLASGDRLHPLQQAFLDHDAFRAFGLRQSHMPHDHWRIWKIARDLGLHG